VVRSVFGTDTATTDLSLEACQRARELFGLPTAAVNSSRLSILPFSMFEINHGVSGSHYRLFWLINFRSES
jgi:hypothetical protein